MKAIRVLLMPIFAVSVTVLVLWYFHLPVAVDASNMAQVESMVALNGT